MHSWFHRFAKSTSDVAGSPWTFGAALALILVWGLTGPMFGFSDTWQLVINTGTTIITFLMVFLIQNTQNRDSRAIHLKLDELIRTQKEARDSLIDLEELSDEDLDKLQKQFQGMQAQSHPSEVEAIVVRGGGIKHRKSGRKSQ